MPGDYSRFSDQPKSRFSAVLMQQGRVQLDADWNESVAILKRRIEREANDIFGPAAVPRAIAPNGFLIAFTGTPAVPDFTVAPGRIYVDGILAECFEGESVTYSKQPFLPQPPTLTGMTGDVLVYLDVWEREITAVEDGSIVDSALGGIDTGTRLQTVWQVKVVPPAEGSAVTCDVDFASLFPPSAARLSTRTKPASEAPDPCSLPDSGGYQGVDNRLYRVEVHDPEKGHFKWSRDNASIATSVLALAHGATTTLTVARVGRDEDLGFRPNDWVELTDDLAELAGRAGVMARVTVVDDAARTLTLDRSLATAGFDPSGKNRLRVRRWDQKDGVDPVTGLLTANPTTWITLENGIEVLLTTAAGGAMHVADAWVFAARAGSALVETLTAAPPRAIVHHYCALGTLEGLGGTAAPSVDDCRVPWPPLTTGGDDCSCTVCVQAIDHNTGKLTIHQAIEQAKHTGGTVCLGVGTFELGETPVVIEGAIAVRLRGQGGATILHFAGRGAAITVRQSIQVDVTDLSVVCDGPRNRVCVALDSTVLASVQRCDLLAGGEGDSGFGFGVVLAGFVAGGLVCDNFVAATVGSYAVASVGQEALETAALLESSQRFAGFYDIDIRTNWFFCQQFGIAWIGQLVFGATDIANNWIASGGGGILITGAATGGPLQIAGNRLHVGRNGISVLTNDVVLRDNVVTGSAGGQRAVPPVGIAIASGDETNGSVGLVSATVDRNEITTFQGAAIRFAGDAQRLHIRDNVIAQVGAGILMGDESTGEEVVIEGNDLRDVGATDAFPPHADATTGIQAVRVGSLLVRGNTLTNLGSAVTDGTPITGIRVVQASRCSVDDNVIQLIGAGGTSSSRTLGVDVFGAFNEARVHGNRVQAASSIDTLPFSGIAVTAGAEEISDANHRFRIVPIDESRVVFSTPESFILIARGQQDADVSTNSVDLVPSSLPLVRVLVGGACFCRGNRVARLSPFMPSNDPAPLPSGAFATTAVWVTASTLIASDNHVNAYRTEVAGMVLTVQGKNPRYTVLGNVCTTRITLNGAALEAPWAPLNVES